MTADLFDKDGSPKFSDLGLSAFEPYKWIETRPFDEHRPEIGPDQYGTANGIIVGRPRVTAHTVTGADNLLAIGRFGVGYDNVDVSACTRADVLAFITVGAVDHSMAEATIGWMLALCHHIRVYCNTLYQLIQRVRIAVDANKCGVGLLAACSYTHSKQEITWPRLNIGR